MTTSPRAEVLARWPRVAVPVTLVVVFLCTCLVGVPLLSAAAYALWCAVWWALGIGAVRGRLPDRFTRSVLGAAVGVAGQLVCWAVFQAIGQPRLTPLGGLLAAVVAALLLRRPAPAAGQGPPAYALLAWVAATLWGADRAVAFDARQTLPPGPSTMYQDLFWHLGLAGELKHALLPRTPQADVGRLNYHWLSDAYMAVGSLGTGRPTADIALRLWVVPVVALITALCLVVGRRLAGDWLTGSIAAALLVWGAGIVPVPWLGHAPLDALAWASPSQIFGLLFTLLALLPISSLLRGPRPRPALVGVLLIVALGCSGAKSSILPVFVGAGLLTLLVFVRRPSARRGGLVVTLVCAVAIGATSWVFAGGSAGSRPRLFSSARLTWAYSAHSHVGRGPGHGALLPAQLLSPGGLVIMTAVLLATLLTYGFAATALALGRTWCTDPMPTFLLGGLLAALAAYQLIDHTGGSQGYFPLGALPFATLLCGWGVSAAVRRAPDASRRRWVLVAVAAAAGSLVVQHIDVRPRPGLVPLVVGVPALLLVIVAVAFLRGDRRHAGVVGAVLVGAALVNATVEDNAVLAFRALFDGPVHSQPWTVLPDESAAARWLGDHSAPDTLVATNVHCRAVRTTPGCIASAFWVSGFSGRRMLVESWSYTDAAQRAAGQHDLPAVRQPYPDARTFALNEQAFTRPTPQVLAALRSRGVRWLFADSRAGSVSPALASLADAVHLGGPVTVYRLRG